MKVRKLSVITAALLCLSGAASAEYIDSAYYNYSANRVEIGGRFFDDSNGKYATVIVLDDDGNIDSIDDSHIVRIDEAKIENGSFKIHFPVSVSDSKSFTTYIEADGKSRTVGFMYAKNISEIFNTIISRTTAEDFADKVAEYAKELNINDTVYGDIENKTAALKLLFSEKNKAANPDELRNLIEAYSYLEALNESKPELLLDGTNIVAETVLRLDALDSEYGVSAYKLYNNSIKDNSKTVVFEKMKNKGFKNLDEMKRAFIYNCTMAAVKYNKSSGAAFVKGVLSGNNAVNGFDLTNYNSQTSNSIDLKLVNGTEWEKSDIQSILNTKSSAAGGGAKGDVAQGGGKGSGDSGVTIGGGKPAGGYSQNYGADSNNITFGDIDNVPWAKDSILKLSKLGIINGRSADIFAPSENVTRAEFLKMILTAFKLESAGAEINFLDVTAGDWYYEYVKTAFSLGIAGGYGDGYFGANDSITRQDAAVIMARAAKAANITLEKTSEMKDFSDSGSISEYAAESVKSLVESGILHGDENGSFCPKDNCTRAQAAVMIANILEQQEAKGD